MEVKKKKKKGRGNRKKDRKIWENEGTRNEKMNMFIWNYEKIE